MNRPKLTVAVLGLAIFVLLVGVTRTTPLEADSPNAAVPTVVLPTPAATRRAPATTRPASEATAPARIATRALVAPTARPSAVAPKSTSRVAFGPSGTYGSGMSCVNVGPGDAIIMLMFYQSDNGQVAFSFSDPAWLPAGSSRNYFTPSNPPGIPSPFSGSVVAASNQPLACNVNTQKTNPGVGGQTNPARIGTSESVDPTRAATTLYAPQLFKNFGSTTFNSYLAIQNGESTAQTVLVSYKDRYGTAYPGATQSVSIPAASNHVFYQDQNAGLPNNFLGSAVVTSAGRLAAVADFYNGAADWTTSQLHSYTAFTSGANKVFVPRFVRNYYGYNGGLTVQNVGTSSTTVQITFNFNGTLYVYNSPSIAAGANLALYAANVTELNPVDSLAVSLRTGSAVIQAAVGGTVVAIVNEDNRGTCYSASCPPIPPNQIGQGSTYEAFGNGTQTPTVFLMQVPSHVGSEDYSGGFQIGNTTGTGGTCDITFPSSPAANQYGVALPANGSISRYAPNVPNLPNPYNGSVKVTCTQAVVGISNFSARNASYYGDTYVTAPGLNQ